MEHNSEYVLKDKGLIYKEGDHVCMCIWHVVTYDTEQSCFVKEYFDELCL